MTVATLPPNGRDPQPRRPRLASLHAEAAALAAEAAGLQKAQAERLAAATALPDALETLKGLLVERELGTADHAVVDAAKAEVLRLRHVLHTADQTAANARLSARIVQLGAAIRAETSAAVLAEIPKLTADYHRHAKAALVAQAALDGLAAYARGGDSDTDKVAILEAATAAIRTHPDLAESAKRDEAAKAVLGRVRDAWSALPGILARDPEAVCAPLSEAVAMIPCRPEEIAAREGGADAA